MIRLAGELLNVRLFASSGYYCQVETTALCMICNGQWSRLNLIEA